MTDMVTLPRGVVQDAAWALETLDYESTNETRRAAKALRAALAQAGQGEAADPIGYAAVMTYAREPSDPRVMFREDEVDARDAVGAFNSDYHIAPVYGFLFSPAPPPAPAVPEPMPRGWRFNHARASEDPGVWYIGFLDPEDDEFSEVVTVDTGLYYQPDDAELLAKAILARLTDAAPPPPQQGETR